MEEMQLSLKSSGRIKPFNNRVNALCLEGQRHVSCTRGHGSWKGLVWGSKHSKGRDIKLDLNLEE